MYKYKECYKISNQIFKYYKEIIRLIKSNEKESETYKALISRLKTLILEEYNIYSELSKEDIDELLQYIEKKDGESKVRERVQMKILARKEVVNNKYLRGKTINQTLLPGNIKLGLYDFLTSNLKLTTHKKTKEKLDTLVPPTKQDEMFIKYLYKEFNVSYIIDLSPFNTSEFLMVNAELDIDKINPIDIQIIKSNEELYAMYNCLLYAFGIQAISILGKLPKIDNDPECIYNYLYVLTEFDIIISYMNKESLTRLTNYCNETKYRNPAIKENVRSLIYKKRN